MTRDLSKELLIKNLKGANCPSCGKSRYYKTKQGLVKGEYKNCKSCANSIKMGGTGVEYNSVGKRLCSVCKTAPTGWNTYCNTCNVAERKTYWNEVQRFKRYNITKETYFKVLNEQEDSCYACDSKERLCIDHDHKTGKFRGILCHSCNASLGLLKDNETTLLNLIKYLNKEKK